jgi:hypothetical protein
MHFASSVSYPSHPYMLVVHPVSINKALTFRHLRYSSLLLLLVFISNKGYTQDNKTFCMHKTQKIIRTVQTMAVSGCKDLNAFLLLFVFV